VGRARKATALMTICLQRGLKRGEEHKLRGMTKKEFDAEQRAKRLAVI